MSLINAQIIVRVTEINYLGKTLGEVLHYYIIACASKVQENSNLFF